MLPRSMWYSFSYQPSSEGTIAGGIVFFFVEERSAALV